jgi:hypothetical protein
MLKSVSKPLNEVQCSWPRTTIFDPFRIQNCVGMCTGSEKYLMHVKICLLYSSLSELRMHTMVSKILCYARFLYGLTTQISG